MHDEQCTLAEFCAYKVRDIALHIDFAAEARVKKQKKDTKDWVAFNGSSDQPMAEAFQGYFKPLCATSSYSKVFKSY